MFNFVLKISWFKGVYSMHQIPVFTSLSGQNALGIGVRTDCLCILAELGLCYNLSEPFVLNTHFT